MVERDEAELIGYLARYPSLTRLALRDTTDPAAGLAALRKAAEAVHRIPHPIEPDCGLPNWCEAQSQDGVPTFRMDVQDHSDYAERIATAILTALDAADVDGRLEPVWPEGSDQPVEIPPDVVSRARELAAQRLAELGPIQLGYDARERLYNQTVRELLEPVLEPGPVRAAETRIALALAKHAVASFSEGITGQPTDPEVVERYAPLVEGIDAAHLAVLRHVCLRVATNRRRHHEWTLATEDGLLYEAGFRALIESLRPDQIVRLEALGAVRTLSEPAPRWKDDRLRRLLVRLHQRTDGMSLDDVRTELDGADPAQWLDEGEQAGMLSRTDVVRLTDNGHRAAATYLRDLARELTAAYEGIDLEHVAVAQDACWRIVTNYQRRAAR